MTIIYIILVIALLFVAQASPDRQPIATPGNPPPITSSGGRGKEKSKRSNDGDVEAAETQEQVQVQLKPSTASASKQKPYMATTARSNSSSLTTKNSLLTAVAPNPNAGATSTTTTSPQSSTVSKSQIVQTKTTATSSIATPKSISLKSASVADTKIVSSPSATSAGASNAPLSESASTIRDGPSPTQHASLPSHMHSLGKPHPIVDVPLHNKWYDSVNLCVINSDSTDDVRNIATKCRNATNQLGRTNSMCIVGNSGHSGYCSTKDSLYKDRKIFRQGFKDYTDNKYNPILSILDKLKKNDERLLFVGDSTTRQVFDYINCELAREVSKTKKNANIEGYIERYGISKNITNIMEDVNKIFSVKIDKNKNLLSKNINIVLNFGLHYHVYDEYFADVKHVLTYLNHLVGTYPHRLRVFWKESSAQHFNSVDGLYFSETVPNNSTLFKAAKMNPTYQCAPLVEEHIDKNNWRNLVVADIIKSSKLNHIVIIPWFSFTQNLWDLHPSGSQHDCTHFCSTPLLYTPIYSFIDKHIGAPEPAAPTSSGGGGHHGAHGGEETIIEPDLSNVKPRDTYFMKGLFIVLICIFPAAINRWIRNDKLAQASR